MYSEQAHLVLGKGGTLGKVNIELLFYFFWCKANYKYIFTTTHA